MNTLFLTLSRIKDLTERGIYNDLMREFVKHGHEVFIMNSVERRFGEKTHLIEQPHVKILRVKTLNIQKTNVVEKGIGTISLEPLFKKYLKRYWDDVKFDLVLYSTPPITFNNVIKYVKNKCGAKSYLLLKDIFPQNAVDLGMMSVSGPKGFLYQGFRRKEIELYQISDHIGCMSPANVEFLLKHNPNIPAEKVEIAPNSIELSDLGSIDKSEIRTRHHLPMDVPIFIYGGNLGKPQGIPFLIRCLNANKSRSDCHFLVIGTGTELPKLKAWYQENEPESVTVMDGLPKEEYDLLVQSCDVGLIFLGHRFSIPNYPSRLLSYLEYKMPILAATDPNTDIGKIAEENGYGYWCESNDVDAFTRLVEKMLSADRQAMGEKGYEFLCKNYLVENTYNAIMQHV